MGRRRAKKKKSSRKRSRKPKRQKKPRGRVIYVKRRIRGRSGPRDKYFAALPPGKRRSSSGKIYYEYRANHADKYPRRGR